MGNVNYTATEGLKLIGSEVGAWLTETTAGVATGAGASVDLSSNALDLDVTGSLTKSAVATGAELMGWSGWSTSNYLSAVYDADLDITGAITVCAWVKPNVSALMGIVGNYESTGDPGGYRISINSSGNAIMRVYGSVSASEAVSSNVIDINKWSFILGVKTASGILNIYINGVLSGTYSGADISATVNQMHVGVLSLGGIKQFAFSGQIALTRVLPVALTAAQIKTIYNAEKDLFKANAKYTQVGTAYDLDLSLTAANRSESVESSNTVSLNGNQETTFIRRDVSYSLNINRVYASTLPAVRNFLHSVEAGQIFELDRYGSASVPDDPVNVIAQPGFTEQRNGVDDYYTITMNVREVP